MTNHLGHPTEFDARVTCFLWEEKAYVLDLGSLFLLARAFFSISIWVGAGGMMGGSEAQSAWN